MDSATVGVYDADAREIAARLRLVAADDLLAVLRGLFHPGAPTADVGCGSGRDVAWLLQHGYPTVGYDASTGMLREAQAAYPGIDVRQESLPDLAGIPDAAYANVLCSAVLMHLPREDLITAALNLARILRPEGRLYLTYRASRAASEREEDGRLFTDIPVGKLTLLLEAAGLRVLFSSTRAGRDRPEVRWMALAAEKGPLQVARGLHRIQAVLAQDRKVATYKFALVRALCEVGRTEAHAVRWEDAAVCVPLWSLAVRWLIYYWPLVTAPTFIAQIRGERDNAPKPIAFRDALRALADEYTVGGLYAVLRDIDEQPERFRGVLRKIAETIRTGPVTYAGTRGPRLFGYRPSSAGARDGRGVFGWVVVPEPVWLDLCRFDHWIEDSIVVRWARLSAEMNPATTVGTYLPLLLARPGDERDTGEVRRLLQASGSPLECVWSGRPLGGAFDVDHAIPFAVWGNNDLWNLLPCVPALNNAKSDALPTRSLLRRRQDCIVDYWRLYAQAWGRRFDAQLRGALGGAAGEAGWERIALTGLEETVERLAMTRGLARWEP
jgi:SAM-dependent methyltransferase